MINKFPLKVVTTKGIVYQGDVEGVYLFGSEGEFELLPYHYALVASLIRSEIHIAGDEALPIESGVVMFRDNKCTIVAEMQRGYAKPIQKWT